jgi:predicted restriction endonuclease
VDNAVTRDGATFAHISDLIELFLDELEARGTAVLNAKDLPYQEYLLTSHWQDVRHRALAYADHRCQLCGRGKVELHVHHNTYERLGAERASDVVVLCAEHHAKFHGKTS